MGPVRGISYFRGPAMVGPLTLSTGYDMAHEMTSRDGLVLTGRKAWHGMGIVVQDCPTPLQALEIADMDYQVEAKDLYLMQEDGSFLKVQGHKAQVNTTSEEVYAVTSDGFEAYQNRPFVDLCQAVADASGGVAEVETLGSIRSGRVVYCLLRTGSFTVGIGDADRTEQYFLLSNAHDGTRALRGTHTSVRVVCSNTLSAADNGKGEASGFSFRHTKGLVQAVELAMRGMAQAMEDGKRWEQQAQALGDVPMTDAKLADFFGQAYVKAYGALPVLGSEKALKAHQRAERVMGAWVENMEDPKQQLGGTQGTAWAALNSITQWADHSSTVRAKKGQSRDDARVASNMLGASSKLKSAALQVALAVL